MHRPFQKRCILKLPLVEIKCSREKLPGGTARLSIMTDDKIQRKQSWNNTRCLRCIPQWCMCIWFIYESQYWASNSIGHHGTSWWGWFSIFFTLLHIIQCFWQLSLGQNISMSYEHGVEVFGRILADMLRLRTGLGLLGLQNSSHPGTTTPTWGLTARSHETLPCQEYVHMCS